MNEQVPMRFLVTSSNGPAECRMAVSGVLKRMRKEAIDLGVTLDVLETVGQHGPKSAVVIAYGVASAEFGKRWCGSIKWHVKSPLRPHHKRTNWFVGVSVVANVKRAAVDIQRQDVTFESFRAGGPGGQHQNTTDSAVRAVHLPSGLTAVAREMRSQHRNKVLAFARLQALADACAVADLKDAKEAQNQLHNALARGNPVRCFYGVSFNEKGGQRC